MPMAAKLDKVTASTRWGGRGNGEQGAKGDDKLRLPRAQKAKKSEIAVGRWRFKLPSRGRTCSFTEKDLNKVA